MAASRVDDQHVTKLLSSRKLQIAALFALVSLLFFVGTLFWSSRPSPPQSAEQSTFSRSALGHSIFAKLLVESGHPVQISRRRMHEGGRPIDGIQLLLEPQNYSRDTLRNWIFRARQVVVVLPKRRAVIDKKKSEFVSAGPLLDLIDPREVMQLLDSEGSVVRPASSSQFIATWEAKLDEPAIEDLQLIKSDKFVSLLGTADGSLVSLLRDQGRTTLIISDPDLISNFGILRGNNPAIVLAAISAAGFDKGSPIVINEAIHGFVRERSLTREATEFPNVIALCAALVALLLIAWAALIRFGSPLQEHTLLRPGGRILRQHTAELLTIGGHREYVLQRYFRATVLLLAERLHAPKRLNFQELVTWLADYAKRRKISDDFVALARATTSYFPPDRSGERAMISVAARIYRFRQELIYGSQRSSRAL